MLYYFIKIEVIKMKKLLLFLSVSLSLTSLNALRVQPIDGSSQDGPIELTEYQIQSFDLFSDLQENIDEGIIPDSDKVVQIQCLREPFITLLHLLEGEGEDRQMLNDISVDQVLEIIKVADYVGLKRDDIKIVLAKRFIQIAPEIPWQSFAQNFVPLHNVFNDKGCLKILSAKIQNYVKPELLQTLSGHTDWIFSASWSPNGNQLATVSDDGTAKIWNVHTSECLQTLEGHTRWVKSVSWSPDGSMVTTGSGDNTVKIWDVQSGECLQTLEGHTRLIYSVNWSPDGTKLATGSSDGTAKIWNTHTGKYLQALSDHTNPIFSVSWSPDNNRLATGSRNNKAKIWNVQSGECLQTLEGHRGSVYSVSWSPDGSMVATGSNDGTAKIWNVHTETCLHTLTDHTGWVFSVSWSPDGTKLATASNDNTAKIWNVNTGRCLHTLTDHTNVVFSVSWSPDGTKLATTSNDNTAKIWGWQQLNIWQLLFVVKARKGLDISIVNQSAHLKACWKSLPERLQKQLAPGTLDFVPWYNVFQELHNSLPQSVKNKLPCKSLYESFKNNVSRNIHKMLGNDDKLRLLK
jgi:WD40 repeat protein